MYSYVFGKFFSKMLGSIFTPQIALLILIMGIESLSNSELY